MYAEGAGAKRSRARLRGRSPSRPCAAQRSLVEAVRASVEQPLPGEVGVRLSVHDVALLVLELFVELRVPGGALRLALELRPQRVRVLDEGDALEVARVRDAEASHAVRVPPLLEVALEGARAHVGLVAADLAPVLDVEAVELVEPVGDGLAVPAERQVERVVDRLLLLLVVVLVLVLLRLRRRRQIALDLVVRARLLLLDHGRRLVDYLRQKLAQVAGHLLEEGELAVPAAAAAALPAVVPLLLGR
mmetsp:Transcript_34458/g.103172  ORF Transcript_34458/g.103172 Transcript_34458/m.103172 type:complete len:247 (-) Transcript_34458:1310-2050(-)